MDTKNFEKNVSLMNVDVASQQICLAGRVEGVDGTTTFNRLVTFAYQSLGSIVKSTVKTVKGDFVDVSLTLTIEELNPDEAGCDEVAPGVENCEFQQTITTGCKLKGSLQKEGDKSKVTLKCDLGEGFSAFGLNDSANQDLLENVTDAYPRRSNLKVNTSKGKIRFTQRGEPAPDGLDVDLICATSTPTPTPPPAQ